MSKLNKEQKLRNYKCFEERQYTMITDGGGAYLTIKQVEARIQLNFDQILDEIKDSTEVDIVTYSLQKFDFIANLIKAGKKVRIMLNPHSRTFDDAYKQLKDMGLESSIIRNDTIHSKWILADPNFVYTGSQNLVDSDSFENVLIFNDADLYSYYKDAFTKICNDHTRTNTIKPRNKTFIPKNYGNNTSMPYENTSSILVGPLKIKTSALGTASWNQKFNGYHNKNITITTLTIPSFDYADMIVGKILAQGNKLKIIANDIAKDSLKKLKDAHPQLDTCTLPNIHSKLALISDPQNGRKIVWSSSQNLGSSTWTEDLIHIKSVRVYDYFWFNLGEVLGRVDD